MQRIWRSRQAGHGDRVTVARGGFDASKYKTVPKSSWEHFFTLGKVFQVPLGVSEQKDHPGHDRNHGVRFRRLVVIEPGLNSSKCLVIKTYEKKATTRSDILPKQSEHAAIHTKGQPKLLQGEIRLCRSIKVLPENQATVLPPLARLNYGQVFEVPHTDKVYSLGHVSTDCLSNFTQDYQRVWVKSETPAASHKPHEPHELHEPPEAHELPNDSTIGPTGEETVQSKEPISAAVGVQSRLFDAVDTLGPISQFLVSGSESDSSQDPDHDLPQAKPPQQDLDGNDEHMDTFKMEEALRSEQAVSPATEDPEQIGTATGQVEEDDCEKDNTEEDQEEDQSAEQHHIDTCRAEPDQTEHQWQIVLYQGNPRLGSAEKLIPEEPGLDENADFSSELHVNPEPSHEGDGSSLSGIVNHVGYLPTAVSEQPELLEVVNPASGSTGAATDSSETAGLASSPIHSASPTEEPHLQPIVEPTPRPSRSSLNEVVTPELDGLLDSLEVSPADSSSTYSNSGPANPGTGRRNAPQECGDSVLSSPKYTFRDHNFLRLSPEEIRARPVSPTGSTGRHDSAQMNTPESTYEPDSIPKSLKLDIPIHEPCQMAGSYPSDPIAEPDVPPSEIPKPASPASSAHVSPKTKTDPAMEGVDWETKTSSTPRSPRNHPLTPEQSSPSTSRSASPEKLPTTSAAPKPIPQTTTYNNVADGQYLRGHTYVPPQGHSSQPQYHHGQYTTGEQLFHSNWQPGFNNAGNYSPFTAPFPTHQQPVYHAQPTTYAPFSPTYQGFPTPEFPPPNRPWPLNMQQNPSWPTLPQPAFQPPSTPVSNLNYHQHAYHPHPNPTYNAPPTPATSDTSSQTSSPKFEKDVVLFSATLSHTIPLCALLDTGASLNFLRQDHAQTMGLQLLPYQGVSVRLGDGRSIKPEYVVHARWRFNESGNRRTTWTDLFVVLPHMERDVIIGCEAIQQRSFLLMNHELNVLGIAPMSKEDREALERKTEQDKEKEAKEDKERLRKMAERRKKKKARKDPVPGSEEEEFHSANEE